MNTKECQSLLSYADDAYSAICENEEYAVYGQMLDENEDDMESEF